MKKHAPKKRVSGFALIATLMMLILLLLLAVGIQSVSAISLRSAKQSDAMMQAQANARMALMIAIGELQKQMGPDQRVSASANILSLDNSGATVTVANPHWTGVWDSWIAGDPANAPVGANYPSGPSHHQTLGSPADSTMHPDYANKENHFRRWLVSLLDDEINSSNPTETALTSLSGVRLPDSDTTAIQLVGEGSLGKKSPETDFVNARLLEIKDTTTSETTGRYAWWVGDESQKAAILADSYVSNPPSNSAEKIYRSQAPGSTGTKTITGLEGITDDSQLETLPSLKTLDLVNANRDEDDKTKPADAFHTITPHSYSVLADVREGGLKRDLSTILEQPIELTDSGDEYMLYAFDDPRFPYLGNPNDQNRANSRVPIQDLAAYYQLYDHQPAFANGRKGGVQYTSSALANSLQIHVPDYDGGIKDNRRLNREYTSLYRRPVVTKIQFLLGVTAQLITQADRDLVQGIIDGTVPVPPNPYAYSGNGQGWRNNLRPIRPTDKYRLRLGIQPMVTLWNPSNLPLVMESRQILTYNAPPFGIKIRKYRDGIATPYESRWMNLGYANDNAGGTTAGQGGGSLLKLRLANNPIVFEPGEVKVFSLPSSTASNLTDGGSTILNWGGNTLNVENKWDPFGVFLLRNSASVGNYGDQTPDVFLFNLDIKAQCLVFGDNDSISISVDSERASTANDMRDGRNASRNAEIQGAGFSLYMFDEGYGAAPSADALRNDIMISRHGSQTIPNRTALGAFYGTLMAPGFPGGVTPLPADIKTNAIPASQIKESMNEKEIIGIMDFSLSIGSETSSTASGGFGGGRRIASRPFLHSATSAMPFIAQSEMDSLYDYGWDWQVSKINAVEDSIIQAKPNTGNGYYGGGYNVENGTTHVIQSEIPVLPPISIASLSHAHLGGFSMAKAIPVGENPDTDKFARGSAGVVNPTGVSFQRVTASGQNGLAPHVVQAIGNSYAHPNIPADKSFVTKQRTFDLDEGTFNIPYVDHSYLANKALWDEFYFSSIAPQPSKVPLFGGTGSTAKQVADKFFKLTPPLSLSHLPNRRIIPYTTNLNQSKLDTLFTQASVYTNGLADKIATHLMVEGAFNVNSTSVEAWKIFFSSLKGKPVAYLDGGASPKEVTPEGTSFSGGSLPNGAPVKTADIDDINAPEEQWKSGRELTDDEINELAIAMVKQVKLRGPFLSMSEFVNRRLTSPGPDGMALKGALQAALDDPSVSINANFRTPGRLLDSETASIPFAFPDAAKGPVAYGSMAYVDQADVLRGFAEQLTPRGDTFVIRTYGDSLDSTGKVVARAWCEAVVQRVPEYVDSLDESHVKSADLASNRNRNFGRKIQIVSFRWLNSSEI
jgi:type II secretory pathway pseudopilin PulG